MKIDTLIHYMNKIKILVVIELMLVFKEVQTTNGNISDIIVNPILTSKNHGNYVQLSIKWRSTLPNNSTRYDIIIRTVSNTTQKPHCKNEICSEYGYKSTEIILPEYPEIKEHGECILKLGCDYNVLVETANKDFNSSVNYNVDDCINGICSCYYDFHIPKVDKFSAVFEKNATQLKISVTYDNISAFNYHNVRIFNVTSISAIRLRLIKPKFNSHLLWGGRSEQIFDQTVSLEPNSTRVKNVIREEVILLIDESINLQRDINYTLRATLIDNRNCEGRIKDAIVYLPSEITTHANITDAESHYKWIIIAVISLVVTITLLSIVVVTWVIKYRKSRKIVNNWRGVYNNVPSSITTSMNIQMHDNALYIEKELLEAKARGELDILEIPHAAIKIGKEIGKGAFGRVFCANALGIPGKPSPTLVAVKQLKRRPTTDELEEFIGEIATMRKVGKHPNIVGLLGFCTIKQPLMMIMEYVGCGDLLGYLRKIRDKRIQSQSLHYLNWTISNSGKYLKSSSSSRSSYSHSSNIINNNNSNESKQRCNYPDMFHTSSTSSEISSYATPETVIMRHPSSNAETMTTLLGSELEATSLLQFSGKQSQTIDQLNYILDHNELHNFAIQIARGMSHLEEKKITHRDLAARNILIDEQKVLKISDFGLSRTGIYINTKNKRVPLRWLSLEAIKDNLYSSKSDVWAYGIVLWEIGTLGGFPYPTVCNTEILSFLSSGKRLDRPENCTNQLYDLMLKCWSTNPDDRPNFQEILDQLDPQKQPIYIDFNELDPNYAFPPTIDEVGFINSNDGSNSISKHLDDISSKK